MLVSEAEVGPGAFEAFLQRAVFLGRLLDAVLETGGLGDELLDGLAGDHLFDVADLAHQFADPLPLREDLLLCSGEFFLGVERAFAPGRFDPLVLLLGFVVVTVAVVGDGVLNEGPRVGVLVEERGGDLGSFGDGPDGQPASLSAELPDRLFDSGELVLGLAAPGGNGCRGGGGRGGHACFTAVLLAGRFLGPEGRVPDPSEVVLGSSQVEGEGLVEHADGLHCPFQAVDRAGGRFEDLVQVVGCGTVGGAFGEQPPLLAFAVPVDEVSAGHDELVAAVAVQIPGAGVAVDHGLEGAEAAVGGSAPTGEVDREGLGFLRKLELNQVSKVGAAMSAVRTSSRSPMVRLTTAPRTTGSSTSAGAGAVTPTHPRQPPERR